MPEALDPPQRDAMLTGSVAERVASEKRTLHQKDAAFTCRIFVAPTAVRTVWRRDCLAPDPFAWIRPKWGYFRTLNLDRPIGREESSSPPPWRGVKEACTMEDEHSLISGLRMHIDFELCS